MSKLHRLYFTFDARAHIKHLQQMKVPKRFPRSVIFELLAMDRNTTQETIKKQYEQVMQIINEDEEERKKIDPLVLQYFMGAKALMCFEESVDMEEKKYIDPNRYDEEFVKNVKQFLVVITIFTVVICYLIYRYSTKKVATPEQIERYMQYMKNQPRKDTFYEKYMMPRSKPN